MNRVGAGEAVYVAAVLTLYADLPDTPIRPSPMDQSVARKLHQEAVPLSLVESALCSPPCDGSAGLPSFLRFRRFGLLPTSCRSLPSC